MPTISHAASSSSSDKRPEIGAGKTGGRNDNSPTFHHTIFLRFSHFDLSFDEILINRFVLPSSLGPFPAFLSASVMAKVGCPQFLETMPLLNLAAALTIDAPNFGQQHLGISYLEWLTNSIFVSLLVSVAVILVARRATRQMLLVPGPTQNIFEALVEFLYDSVESIVGKHMVSRVFGFLVTLFIFILFSNWFALLPGVGSIGWGHQTPTGFSVDVPLLRPTTADLNMTLGMALVFMALWVYWTLSEVGLRGFLEHTFGPKGGLQGIVKLLLIPIFFFVGIIEIVSILFRPVALSLRLFGNIFAGENLLTTMIGIGKQVGLPGWAASIASVTLPIPFYFLELLVGLLQATVFTLLCAVYIQLSTSHDEDEEH